jgi:hypothetical protein
MSADLLVLFAPRLWPGKTSMLGDPLGLPITASQVTHVSAYADAATWPGDRLRLPLDPQPQRQLNG